MNSVDILYDLIKKDSSIKTFEDNKELFKKFFFSGMSIKYEGPKVKDIMLYLLKINPDEYDFPMLKQSIFKAFYMYEQYVTQSTYSEGEDLTSKTDEIKDLIDFYNKLRDFDQEEKYLKNSIFVRDYTGAMIVLLNNAFFKMENEEIKYCIEHIKNNDYIKEIINGNNGKALLDKDYIFQYFSRYLFTTEFVNIDNVENDILLNNLLDGKIKDIDFVKSAYKNMNISFIVDYDKSLDRIISGLDNITDDELKKNEISTIIINKLIGKREYYYLFKYYINHINTNLLSEENKKNLVDIISNSFPPELDEEDVKFLLTQDLSSVTYRNLKIKMQTENWSDEIKEKINKKTEKITVDDISFDTAIGIMKEVFSDKKDGKKIQISHVLRSLTTIIKTYLNDDSIKVNNDFVLLDTPGVLPMNYDDKKHATNLALVGSVREDILPNDVLVKSLLIILRDYYPKSLLERYGIEEISEDHQVLEQIATRRGLKSAGELDIEKAEITLLKDFKDGRICIRYCEILECYFGCGRGRNIRTT